MTGAGCSYYEREAYRLETNSRFWEVLPNFLKDYVGGADVASNTVNGWHNYVRSALRNAVGETAKDLIELWQYGEGLNLQEGDMVVYGLGTGTIIYFGVADGDIGRRMLCHKFDRSSSAYEIIRHEKARGTVLGRIVNSGRENKERDRELCEIVEELTRTYFGDIVKLANKTVPTTSICNCSVCVSRFLFNLYVCDAMAALLCNVLRRRFVCRLEHVLCLTVSILCVL